MGGPGVPGCMAIGHWGRGPDHRAVSQSPANCSDHDMILSTAELAHIREQFDFARSGRVVTNNAASTQPPRQLLDLYRSLIPQYENVHRGQSSASMRTTG